MEPDVCCHLGAQKVQDTWSVCAGCFICVICWLTMYEALEILCRILDISNYVQITRRISDLMYCLLVVGSHVASKGRQLNFPDMKPYEIVTPTI